MLLAIYSKSQESFHMKCQRHTLGVTWLDCISNTEITEDTGLPLLMVDLIVRKMLGPFATASRYIAIHQVSLLSHAATVARRLRINVHNHDDDDSNDNV